MTAAERPETLGFKAFADHLGCKPSYVTQLKKDGRLILTTDGKQIIVGASLERIEATKDPAAAGVAARHATARGAALQPPESKAQFTPHTEAKAEPDKIGSTYQAARAVKERYLAMSAKRDYEVSIGKLLEADEVRAQLVGAITVLRNDLESIPENIAPALAAEPDENRVRLLLAEEIEHALANLVLRFDDIAKGAPV